MKNPVSKRYISSAAGIFIVFLVTLLAAVIIVFQINIDIRYYRSEVPQLLNSIVQTFPNPQKTFSYPGVSLTTLSTTTYSGKKPNVIVEYPQIDLGAPSTVSAQEKINTIIASTSKETYKNSVTNLNQTLEAGDASGLLEYKEIITGERMYLSTTTSIFSYDVMGYGYSGGAHGTSAYGTETYDLMTGKELTLKDLLKGDYAAFLKKYMQDQIEQQTRNCTGCARLGDDPDKFWWRKDIPLDTFIIDDKGMTFLFSDYSLGSYADSAGGQEILIPKDVLKSYIKRDW